MRLTQPLVGGAAWSLVETAVSQGLSARLDLHSTTPIVVALSGGGDSVALLIAVRRWAICAGRPVVCLTVDHQLSPLSSAWSRACAYRAHALGLDHRTLVWSGAKPSSSVPAAARTARHALVADAARAVGASLVLMGHTADDRLEARAMRAQGCRVSDPRAWSPSPAWPEGRGVFILRPLIDVRRETIRRGLHELGETWLDDPANDAEASLRARVRRDLGGSGDIAPVAEGAEAAALFGAAKVGWAGEIAIGLGALAAAPPPSRKRFLSAALVCAAGGDSPPRGAAVDRLWSGLETGPRIALTLAGARAERDGETVRVMRDDGAPLRPWATGTFDGRFEIEDRLGAGEVFALRGHMAGLDRRQRAALRALPPAARRGTPAVHREDGSVSCLLLENDAVSRARSLVRRRLAGACGAVADEATIARVGEMAFGVLDRSASKERSVHEPA